MRTLLSAVMALALIGAPAHAQDSADDEDMLVVWFPSYACPEQTGDGPGTRASPIEMRNFSDAFYASSLRGDETRSQRHAQYHCKWVRLAGFMTWMDYYHYRGELKEDFASAHFVGEAPRYIIENFVGEGPSRGGVAQRRISVVGRFYNLCAAAEETERASGETWGMLFGPCHYGADNGMMLADVTLEAVHDDAPVYLLGDMNRAALGFAPLVVGAERDAMAAATREFISLAQRGAEHYADIVLTRFDWDDEDERRGARANLVSADSYVSHLNRDPRFRRLNPRRARVELFWDGERRDSAHGCMCLVRDCTDRWPLFTGDANNFLGDAVCTELELRDGAWRWS